MRKDRKQRRLRTIENYILKTGCIKKALKELTDMKNWVVKMKDNRGKFNHNRIDILKTATSYYKNLYRNNTKQAEINLVDTSNIPSVLQAEVSKAIDTQKREKAQGPDGISNEILKYSKEILLPVLTDMFNDITNTKTIPQQ
ncbi:LINE-1 retrotransposable element ORF2 protein [Eumeta japonica]|uniref:LINE-1 retrotransposable element ORF2 protein n=1 Tax=Eumeta variegata TaxID=151549 RepID=A0A4C1YCT6_EUMVA|nr:LINE-1 retrotransposable element ORF2 protein [Eumeta japonica]